MIAVICSPLYRRSEADAERVIRRQTRACYFKQQHRLDVVGGAAQSAQ